MSRLESWSQGLGPSLLWLEGPVLELDELENPFTGIAAKIIHLIENHHLPVISYFCELSRKIQGDITQEETATISLLYALMRQVIEALPPYLEITVDLSEERLTSLDGTLKTWSKAVEFFRDLLNVSSGIVFCVIDGVHWLDSSSTDTLLADLLDLMRNEHLRVLLTTSGRSGCLNDSLRREETCGVQDLFYHQFTHDLDWALSLDDGPPSSAH